MQFHFLLALAIIGLLLSFVFIPLIACLIRFVVKRRYTDYFSYNAYSSASIASYVNKSRKTSHPFPPTSFSCSLVSASLFTIITCFFAIFALAGSFYFNNAFSKSADRTGDSLLNINVDLARIGGKFVSDFGIVGKTLEEDTEVKMNFAKRSFQNMGNVLKNSNAAFGIGTKSGFFPLIFSVFALEQTMIVPVQHVLQNSRTALDQLVYSERALNAVATNSNITDSLSQTCANRRFDFSNRNQCPGYWDDVRCNFCLAPDLPTNIEPNSLSHYLNFSIIRTQLRQMWQLSDQLKNTNERQLINAGLIGNKVSSLQGSFENDFKQWMDHYQQIFGVLFDSQCVGFGMISRKHQIPYF